MYICKAGMPVMNTLNQFSKLILFRALFQRKSSEPIGDFGYEAAKGINRILLATYFAIGKYIYLNSRQGLWGNGAIETISEDQSLFNLVIKLWQ